MLDKPRRTLINLLFAVGVPTFYAVLKAGALGATLVLAAEWGPLGVQVNAIAPGYFRTRMTERLFADPAWTQRLLLQVPLGRIGEPKDFVGIAVFLAFDASVYLTGQVIYVDGGYLCAQPA